MLIWTISGLIMVVKPNDEVRGVDLIKPLKPMHAMSQVVVPNLAGLPVNTLAFDQRSDGPRWTIVLDDGTTRRADPATGLLLPPLSATDAVRAVMSRYTGQAMVVATTRTDPKKPPLELRKPIATWNVQMSDDTHFYVDV